MTRRPFGVLLAVLAALVGIAVLPRIADARAPGDTFTCTDNGATFSCPKQVVTRTATKTVTVTRTAPGPTVTVNAPAPSASATPSPSTTTAEPSPIPTSAVPSSTSASPTPTPTPTAIAPTNLKRIPEDVKSGPGWAYDSRGWVSISGQGATFSGYKVTVNVDVTASGVTISGNEFALSEGEWGITLRHAENVTIKANSIHGPSGSQPCDNAIRDIYGDIDNVTITDNEMYWCNSGINHFDGGGLIQGNVIRDIGDTDGCPPNDVNCGHWNGIQLGAGYGPLMVIDSNTILVPAQATDAIMLANDDGPQTNRTITNNLLGGGGYTFYGSGGPDGRATNIVFTGNKFTTRYFPNAGYYGPVAHWKSGNGNVFDRNVWADGPNAGQLVNP